MKLETKKKIGAFIGYPLTYLCFLIDKTEAQKKYTLESREIFKSRIFGTRLR